MTHELIGHFHQGEFQGMRMNHFFGNWESNAEVSNLPIELFVHPNESGRILINIPGFNGAIDGFADKYVKLAHHIQSSGLAAVIRTDNKTTPNYRGSDRLRAAIQFATEQSEEISGVDKPDLLLMGFSAGAGSIAAVAHKFPEVSAILLFAPSTDEGKELIKEGLSKFSGRMTVVIGDSDEIVGTKSGQFFHDLATAASNRELFVLPNCDHRFTGEQNGRFISQAPFYAFAYEDMPNFPDPNGGIKLYD